MRFGNCSLVALGALSLCLFCSAAAFADPPGRAGRLNYISGSVSFRPGDLDDWSPAAINIPLKSGDHLWTDASSQAEIHVGSTAIRLAAETAFAFLNLDDHAIQIQLTQGAVNLRVRQLMDADFVEVDTPNSAVSLLRPGWYRVNVDSQGNTTVVDRQSESEITAQGQAFTLHPREAATITGTDAPTYEVQAAVPPDSWDNWCAARDRREDQAVSVRYVPREMVGYEDLDVYGGWQTYPEYGPVWIPASVPPGWAPYRYGHWMWVDPWGWTWVDDMPWGFAPFHYGRWVFVGGAWAWVPGRIVARPVYAPALVAFVGGSNWHVSLSIGSGVAWFPLGPREVYVPAYHASPEYVRNVNITHVNVTNINVTNVNVVNTTYVNRNVPGAVTAVPQAAFVHAQPVSKAAVNVPQQAIASAPVTGMAAPVAPQRESLAATPHTSAPVPHPAVQAFNRPVVAKMTPPPPPVSFAAKQAALVANPGKPLDPAAEANLRRTAAPERAIVKPAIPANPPSAAPGLRPARPEILETHPVAKSAPSPVVSPAIPAKPIGTVNDRPRGAVAAASPQPAAPAQPQARTIGPVERNDRPNKPVPQTQPSPELRGQQRPAAPVQRGNPPLERPQEKARREEKPANTGRGDDKGKGRQPEKKEEEPKPPR